MSHRKAPYLLYEKVKRTGPCRFCKQRTRMSVKPPEIVQEIRSPIYVCPKCKTIQWKMNELGILFNRTVDIIISLSELPVIPARSQLRPQTGVSIQNIEKKRIFDHVEDWIAEQKLGGTRIIAYILKIQVRFLTSPLNNRTGMYRDITEHIPHLQFSIPELEGTVLDGELVSSTEIMDPERFIVFDCLKYRGIDIRGLELEVRQCSLTKIFDSIGEHPYWEPIKIFKPTTPDEIKGYYEETIKAGYEGLTLKNLRSPYKGAITNEWVQWRKR